MTFSHETNSFAPGLTAYRNFSECAMTGAVLRGDDLHAFLGTSPTAAGGFFRRARSAGHDVDPLLVAFAEPSGIISTDCFETIADELTSMLRARAPHDSVFIELHGAMITQDHDDGEREVLRRLRAVVGSAVPIACALDLHGNIAPDTLADADVASAFRTYPHIDMAQTGERAYDLLAQIHAGSRFAFAHRQLPFLMPIDRQSHFQEPCKSLYEALERIEQDSPEPVSLNLMLGFPLSDIAAAGPSIFAYARSQPAADAAVQALLAEVMQRESQFVSRLTSAAEAARLAQSWQGEKPLIIADVQDNAGGGATSDTIEILEALIKEGVDDAIVGLVHDPMTVQAAHRAGVGNSFDAQLGGKLMPGQQPLQARFVVERVSMTPVQLTGPVGRGMVVNLGATALLRHGGIRVVVTTGRTQCLDQEYFRHFGLEPAQHRVIVVKSSNHYRAHFQPLAGRIVETESAGACIMDPRTIPYRRLRPGVRLHGLGPIHEPAAISTPASR